MGPMRRAALAALACLAGTAFAASVAVDEKAGTVSVPAVVAKQGKYDVLKGAVEYLLVAKGGKEYESVFITECPPSDVQAALAKLGLTPGEPATPDGPPRGPALRLFVAYEADGKPVRRPAEDFLLYLKTDKPVEPAPWLYTGSFKGFDPTTDKDVLQCDVSKSVVGLHYSDRSPLLENSRAEARNENLYKANAQALPKEGTPVTLVLEREATKAAEGARRVHAFLTGRVQGVGFRAFTQHEAQVLGLTGWVTNLADGRVEAVIEGPKDKVDALLKTIQRGPRAARVDKLDAKDEPPTGEFRAFDVRY